MSLSKDSFWSFRLALTVLVTALVTIAIVFVTKFSLSLWSRTLEADAGNFASPTPADLSLGEHKFALPTNMLAGVKDVAESGQIELEILWPDIEGKTADNFQLFRNRNSASTVIRLRLEIHQEAVGTEERFIRILTPAFAGDPLPGPEGLTGRRFQPGTGFGPDVLYYADPANTTRYLVFCSEPFDHSPPADTAFCQRLVQLDTNLRLEIMFRPALLQDWQGIDEQMTALIRGFMETDQPSGQ